MARRKSDNRLTAGQRQFLRKYGTLPDAQATTLEQIMYRSAVHYRLLKFYHEDDVDGQRMMRVMLRAFAVTLVWKRNPEEPVTEAAVKELERDFLRRAKDDPPF